MSDMTEEPREGESAREPWQTSRLTVFAAEHARNNDSGSVDGLAVS